MAASTPKPWMPERREPLPPTTYPQQMRRSGQWWRAALAIPALLVAFVTVAMLASVPLLLAGAIRADSLQQITPQFSLWMNLFLAVAIPVSFLVTFIHGRVAERGIARLVSVVGRMRWRWTAQATLWLLPLWVLYLGGAWLVDGATVGTPHAQIVAMIAITLLTTPLQAAGEEFFFRGALTQAIGAWFACPWLALLVPMVITTGGFAAAHGSSDIWIILTLSPMGIAGSWLAWRTGGIEAAIVLHVVHNVLVTLSGILLGGLESSYVTQETTGDPVTALISIVAMAIATVLLDWRAQRTGIAPKGWRAPAIG